MPEENDLSFLLELYLADSCSAEQFNRLFSLIEKEEHKQELQLLLKWHWQTESQRENDTDHNWEGMYERLREAAEITPAHTKSLKNPLYNRIAIAASVCFVLFAGLLFLNKTFWKAEVVGQQNLSKLAPLAPGGNKAILTLANGKKIILDDRANGTIISQAGIQITKKADGKLVYKLNQIDAKADQRYLFNTIETPKGGQYEITMPDGTRVWLNAMSALKYPLVFDKSERTVFLSGEAYFEVAKLKGAAFKVVSDLQEIRVLGTHFNVNAYQNENDTRTTLLEGAVNIWSKEKGSLTTLRPGQQSVLKAGHVHVEEVDTELAIAWKNGTFNFNSETLESIMRQVSRWYDVEVIYEDGAVKKQRLSGSISRFENARELIHVLSLTKLVRFKIEGRRIIVMK